MGKGNLLERIFNHWTLLFINITIIILVEATGGFFMETGLVHLIAILFIFLGAGRILIHYNIHDQFLNPFSTGGIMALIILSISHILEYSSYAYFSFPYETVAANVSNLYLVSLLIITFGILYFISQIRKGLKIYLYILPAGVVLGLGATVLFCLNSRLPGELPWLTGFYLLSIIIIAAVAMNRLLLLKKTVGMLRHFINYFSYAFILLTIATLLYVLNEPLQTLGLSYMQIMYMSHFLFYAALSLMFLAYGFLANLGGVFADEAKPE